MDKQNTATKVDYRDKPIPLRQENAASALDYHTVPIDFTNPLFNEPLVSASSHKLAAASYYAREDALNAPYYRKFATSLADVWLRASVAEKLGQVNCGLAPYNAELLLFDGYRPISLQQELWDHFINQAKLSLDNPTEEECVRFAGLYCSDPRGYRDDDYRTWPTHNTGGAVDLALRSSASHELLFFGGVFDDASDLSFTDYFECRVNSADSASIVEARRNRRLLYWAMNEHGFANYAYEWWHFDFGTQMAIANANLQDKKAVYGRAALPE